MKIIFNDGNMQWEGTEKDVLTQENKAIIDDRRYSVYTIRKNKKNDLLFVPYDKDICDYYYRYDEILAHECDVCYIKEEHSTIRYVINPVTNKIVVIEKIINEIKRCHHIKKTPYYNTII
jgi:hypothetical protein